MQIVYSLTYEFFNNNSLCKYDIFSPIVNKENILSLLGLWNDQAG